MTGLNKYDSKQRRLQRRRNHIARDLASNKYRQRVLPDRRRRQIDEDDDGVFFEQIRYDEEYE